MKLRIISITLFAIAVFQSALMADDFGKWKVNDDATNGTTSAILSAENELTMKEFLQVNRASYQFSLCILANEATLTASIEIKKIGNGRSYADGLKSMTLVTKKKSYPIDFNKQEEILQSSYSGGEAKARIYFSVGETMDDVKDFAKDIADPQIIELRLKYIKTTVIKFNTVGFTQAIAAADTKREEAYKKQEEIRQKQLAEWQKIESMAKMGDEKSRIKVAAVQQSQGKLREAFLTFKELAEKGNTEAMCYLAECYIKGMGTIVDGHEAYLWFNIASVYGSQIGRMAALQLNQEGYTYYDEQKAKQIMEKIDKINASKSK